VVCLGTVFTTDACDRSAVLASGAGVLFVLGWLFMGGTVYGVVRAVSDRERVAWASAVLTAVGLGLASYVLLVWQWVEQCSR
jgi:hypothetical protein